MSDRVKLEGLRFGSWEVLEYVGDGKYKCRCDCGREYEVINKNLKRGTSTKCKECYRESTRANIIGKKFGKWEVIEYVGGKKHRCRCECGREYEVFTQTLVEKSSKQCIHCAGLKGAHREELEGSTLGNWEVLEYIGGNKYKCKCKCGNIENIFTYNLKIGHSTQCKECADTQFKDLKDQRFEKWVVLEYITNGYWRCKCDCGNISDVHGNALRTGKSKQCIKCATKSLESAAELELFNRYTDCERNNRSILNGKEIDIYCEKLKIGIEFNGTYWHSTFYKDKMYHQEKTLSCIKKGIQLIHIFEYEWEDAIKKDKLIRFLDSKLKLTDKEKLYARNTVVKKVATPDKKEFLNKYHFQGDARSSVNIGLYKENKLMAVMTFGKPRFDNTYEWELIRYAVDDSTLIIGGAEKLFSYFNNVYKPTSIISYCNISKFTGNVYKKLKFQYIGITEPNYVWVKQKIVLSRYQTQKFKLVSNGIGNYEQTEDDIMYNMGYMKVYDSGNAKFAWLSESNKVKEGENRC